MSMVQYNTGLPYRLFFFFFFFCVYNTCPLPPRSTRFTVSRSCVRWIEMSPPPVY
ncbi:hypothetical protein L873DRAFT_912980 [Choiromyces venosus 120613-1]|uniref:Uncharacterized protein n=1 Tax=Choiromyces venosus 120613-1 TaxID=1336337 RepID=A0A3N4K0R2_9PEZI|nr:hypothetical protein L873DRAFT_912980 [Choiromyces venosus 120613-1]